MTLTHDADGGARARRRTGCRTGSSSASTCTVCSMVTVTSSGLMKRSGCSTSSQQRPADFDCRVSASAWALTLEMRLSPSRRPPGRSADQDTSDDDRRRHGSGCRVPGDQATPSCSWRKPAAPGRASGGPRAAPARGRASPRSRRARRGRGRARAARRARRAGRARRRACRRASAPARRRRPGRPRRRRAAPARRPAAVVVVVERERQHVGRTVLAEVLGVELGDLVAVDEHQRQLAARGPRRRGRRGARSTQRSTSTSTSSCSSAPTTTGSSAPTAPRSRRAVGLGGSPMRHRAAGSPLRS